MNKYEFKATNLIAKTFEMRGVKFDVVNRNGNEQLIAGFSVNCGPNVIARFINTDNDNDVAVRVYGLVSNTPEEKRPRIMDACNMLNRKIRYMKCYLDTDGDINVEYDFPVHSPDDGIGEMAFEVFVRLMQILNAEYSIFMKALYTNESLEANNSTSSGLMQKLQELRRMMESHKSIASAERPED